jgi:hypothetical protein
MPRSASDMDTAWKDMIERWLPAFFKGEPPATGIPRAENMSGGRFAPTRVSYHVAWSTASHSAPSPRGSQSVGSAPSRGPYTLCVTHLV